MPKYMVRLHRDVSYAVEVDVEDEHQALSAAVATAGREHIVGGGDFELASLGHQDAIVEIPDIKVGSIVLPAVLYDSEIIIGVVIHSEIGPDKRVVWISDKRGAFTCDEAPHDLQLASLKLRDDGSTDAHIDHDDLAHHLWQAT